VVALYSIGVSKIYRHFNLQLDHMSA